MVATYFKMKTLRHVATEMGLHVLTYNIKRGIEILGVHKPLEAVAPFLSWPVIAIVHRRDEAAIQYVGSLSLPPVRHRNVRKTGLLSFSVWGTAECMPVVSSGC